MRALQTFLVVIVILLLISGCFISPPSHTSPIDTKEQEFKGQVAVWQGFQHSWSYNHRLHRLGDFVRISSVTDSSTTVENYHIAATGLGEDIGTYTSYYSIAQMEGVEILQDKISSAMHAKKGETAADTQTVRLPLKTSVGEQTQTVAFLNGYDLYTSQNAFKIESLVIGIMAVTVDTATGEAVVKIRSSVRMDCRSIECKKFDTDYNYSLNVHFVVVTTNKNIAVHTRRFVEQYEWNKREELERPAEYQIMRGVGEDQFSNGLLAFKKLSINLDKEHWFIDWNTYLTPYVYSPSTGEFAFKLGLMIREWRKGMRFKSKQPEESIFSMRGSGAADLSTDILLIQYEGGCSSKDTVKGEIEWTREAKNSGNEQAISRRETLWNNECTRATKSSLTTAVDVH